MSLQMAYIIVTVSAAVATTFASIVDFMRAEWVIANMTKYGVPRDWLFLLGVAKAAGAVGLVAGFVVPPIGIAAAAGLTVYFVGAVITVVRSRWYSDVSAPAAFLALAAGTLALGLVQA
ncbi:DoxX family protein [Lentzea sp. NPDC051838]|uniref:DoxX family protein n=1 Tax=Lentzea sp. NPDC051838 TaxID=3154849 RepID=UPI00342E8014